MVKQIVKGSALLLIATFMGSNVHAANQWYWGEVIQIQSYSPDGSFMVTLDNSTVQNNCAHGRVYFQVSSLGVERTKLAFSMALAAFSADKDWGVVVDMPAAGQDCHASPTASQGAGIKH